MEFKNNKRKTCCVVSSKHLRSPNKKHKTIPQTVKYSIHRYHESRETYFICRNTVKLETETDISIVRVKRLFVS